MGVLSVLSGDEPNPVDPAAPSEALPDSHGLREAAVDLTKGDVTLYRDLLVGLPGLLDDGETLLLVSVAQAPVDGTLEPVPAVLALTDRSLLVVEQPDAAPLSIDYLADDVVLSPERGLLADSLLIQWAGGQVLQLADVSKNVRNLPAAVVQQRELALPVTEAAPAAPESPGEAVLSQVRSLGELHADGLLTDEEFAAQKARLLERL
ncbi:SHOCT domain-containing protein [Tessaracoccus sp. G1721]